MLEEGEARGAVAPELGGVGVDVGSLEQPTHLRDVLVDALRTPDLRNKILFTLGMILVFRFLAHVPLPGVNQDQLEVLAAWEVAVEFVELRQPEVVTVKI